MFSIISNYIREILLFTIVAGGLMLIYPSGAWASSATTVDLYPTSNGDWNNIATTWNDAHDAATSSVTVDGGILKVRSDRVSGSDWRIGRSYLNFDTSTINGVVQSAKLHVTLSGNGIDSAMHERTIALVQFFGSTTDAVDDDYDQVGNSVDNPIEGASRIDLELFDQAGTQYVFNLNATGTNWIDTDGVTQLGLRSANDVDDSATNLDGQGRAQFYDSTVSTVAYRPRLEITYIPSTTTTFYPAVDARTMQDTKTSWSQAVDASSARIAHNGQSIVEFRNIKGSGAGSNYYNNTRLHLNFDTSSLPNDAEIVSAELALTGSSEVVTGSERRLYLASSTPASNTSIVKGDYSEVGDTSFGVTDNTWTIEDTNTIEFNSTGLNYIDLDGYTNLAVRGWYDFNGTAPHDTNGEFDLRHYLSEQSGTAKDPTLTIEYTTN